MSSAQEKRQLILDTATKLFSRFGFSKTSLDEIAAAAQIAKGTVYNYFPSKEELFMAAVEQKSEEYLYLIRQHVADLDSFEDKLHAFVHVPVKFVYENMPILIEGVRNMPFQYAQRLLEFRQNNRQRLLKLLKEILDLGHKQNILREDISTDRICEVVLDWFLLGDLNCVVIDIQQFLERIDRDHDMIIKMLLNGILKRG
jgi:AcrR family transcriptional regulator